MNIFSMVLAAMGLVSLVWGVMRRRRAGQDAELVQKDISDQPEMTDMPEMIEHDSGPRGPRIAITLGLVLIGASVFAMLSHLHRESRIRELAQIEAQVREGMRLTNPEPGVSRPPLEIGTLWPPIQAEGWINVPTENYQFALEPNKVCVVDIWAQWSPGCQYTAAYLARTYKKYKDRVQFVGLSYEIPEYVKIFAEKFSMPWPQGYKVPLPLIEKLGAREGGQITRGYEVKPIIYVIDRAGRVYWTDNYMRYKQRDPEYVQEALEAAIESALNETTPDQAESSELEAGGEAPTTSGETPAETPSSADAETRETADGSESSADKSPAAAAEPSSPEPAVDESAENDTLPADEPTGEEPPADEPASDQPASDEPTSDQSNPDESTEAEESVEASID